METDMTNGMMSDIACDIMNRTTGPLWALHAEAQRKKRGPREGPGWWRVWDTVGSICTHELSPFPVFDITHPNRAVWFRTINMLSQPACGNPERFWIFFEPTPRMLAYLAEIAEQGPQIDDYPTEIVDYCKAVLTRVDQNRKPGCGFSSTPRPIPI